MGDSGNSMLQETQEQAEEVKVIMLENYNKAQERHGKLEDLEDRSNMLLEKSKGFSKTTGKVVQKKRWEHIKMKLLLVFIVVLVLAIIIGVAAVMASSPGSSLSSSSTSIKTSVPQVTVPTPVIPEEET
ncbi:vesicle-associated membrane protein 5 [Lepisosteus oculatus]|nr:PREDICTED: vesicle-associated membrane protein 5-like [Lepisosteus oculatus]